VKVFHAGTKLDSKGQIIANGGRVLGVTATGKTVLEAQTNAYKAVNAIKWDDGFCRTDIGWRAIERK
jgi:phosphoribosylamine--glycine ligase